MGFIIDLRASLGQLRCRELSYTVFLAFQCRPRFSCSYYYGTCETIRMKPYQTGNAARNVRGQGIHSPAAKTGEYGGDIFIQPALPVSLAFGPLRA